MIRKPTSDLTIRPKVSPVMVMALVVIGAFFYFASLYWVHGLGARSANESYDDDKALIAELQADVTRLTNESAQVRETLVFAQRQQQIQEEAYKQMSKAYSNSEQKNAVLVSRLSFYRSILSPQDGQSGPVIHSITHQLENDVLSFDITLVQAIDHKENVQGKLVVELHQGGKMFARWPTNSARSVAYQYFQQVSGTIEQVKIVPDSKLKVSLTLKEGGVLERWFDLDQPPSATQSGS